MRGFAQALVLALVAPNAFAKAPAKLITVVTDDWAATKGELRRWERVDGKWRAIGERVPVVVGKNGMKLKKDKREGDGASPAGRFALGDATGYDAAPTGEEMRRGDELYRYTIFVRHNDAHSPGMGSCIFLHVWRDADSPTVGCTAMALDRMRELLQWADSNTELVQLPAREYDRRQRAWGLPQRK